MDDTDLWTRYESHCYNKGLTENRIAKLKTMFNMVTRGLKVPLSQADEDDIRDFVNRLHRDDFTKQRGGAYSGSTKADAKKFLKQFFKWYEGERDQYPDKVIWLSTSIPKDEKPEEKRVIEFDELHEIAQSMPRAEYKALCYILFDSGFRIGEMLSVKKKDLEMDEYGEGECWWIRCRESKTKPRRVPIPLFTSEVNEFAQSGYYKALSSGEDLIQSNYPAILKIIKDRSQDILDEEITPHNFRHSSATYYAKELDGDVFQLCERYGWEYGSDEAKTYVRRSGINQKRAAEKVVNNKLSETNQRVDELEAEKEELKTRLDNVQQVVDELVEKVNPD